MAIPANASYPSRVRTRPLWADAAWCCSRSRRRRWPTVGDAVPVRSVPAPVRLAGERLARSGRVPAHHDRDRPDRLTSHPPGVPRDRVSALRHPAPQRGETRTNASPTKGDADGSGRQDRQRRRGRGRHGSRRPPGKPPAMKAWKPRARAIRFPRTSSRPARRSRMPSGTPWTDLPGASWSPQQRSADTGVSSPRPRSGQRHGESRVGHRHRSPLRSWRNPDLRPAPHRAGPARRPSRRHRHRTTRADRSELARATPIGRTRRGHSGRHLVNPGLRVRAAGWLVRPDRR